MFHPNTEADYDQGKWLPAKDAWKLQGSPSLGRDEQTVQKELHPATSMQRKDYQEPKKKKEHRF